MNRMPLQLTSLRRANLGAWAAPVATRKGRVEKGSYLPGASMWGIVWNRVHE